MSEKKITAKEQEFIEIRDKLAIFNEDLQGDANDPDKKYFKIDFEYIYEIRNMEAEDYDPLSGRRILRPLNEMEMRKVLYDYALESFNVILSRSQNFLSMINTLTERIAELNSEEIAYVSDASNVKDSDERLFTPNDLLFADQYLSDNLGSVTSETPNSLCVEGLQNTINKTVRQMGRGSMRKLTKEEIEEIVDPNFDLGC